MTNTDACMACGHHLEAHRDGGCIAETFQCLCRGFEDFIDPDYPEGSEVTNTEMHEMSLYYYVPLGGMWLKCSCRWERCLGWTLTPEAAMAAATAHREDAERAERNAKATERRATNRRAAERRRERASKSPVKLCTAEDMDDWYEPESQK